MTEYIITRHDSNADNGGKGRHSELVYGTLFATNHREAVSMAYDKFNHNECQWFEADNVKYAKPAKVNAARRCNKETVTDE